MGAITPSFVLDLESRMQVITEREYARLTANLWWQDVAKVRQSTGRKDLLMWLLSTATIRDEGKGGNIAFDDIVTQVTEVENKWAGAGLKLRRDQLEDTDGGGVDLAAAWSADIGAYMAYWPQKTVAQMLKSAHNAALVTAYDKKAFFATDHPINPYKTGVGTFANLFTGAPAAATGTAPAYPGALPIDESVTPDVALANLGKLMGYIASIKMPNGEDPRFLRPRGLLVPPRLYPRALQITNAKFIPQAVTGGAAAVDVEALIRGLGYAQPIVADELAGFEDDRTYFVIAEQMTSSQLGGIIYVEREAFKINYYGVQDQAILDRADELEWHCKGRNVAAAGHPFLLFKVRAV